MRFILMPPDVEPAHAHTIDPNSSRMMANDVQVFVSAVANPEVVTSDTNWNIPCISAEPIVG